MYRLARTQSSAAWMHDSAIYECSDTCRQTQRWPSNSFRSNCLWTERVIERGSPSWMRQVSCPLHKKKRDDCDCGDERRPAAPNDIDYRYGTCPENCVGNTYENRIEAQRHSRDGKEVIFGTSRTREEYSPTECRKQSINSERNPQCSQPRGATLELVFPNVPLFSKEGRDQGQ
jgi:hypothetical protein